MLAQVLCQHIMSLASINYKCKSCKKNHKSCIDSMFTQMTFRHDVQSLYSIFRKRWVKMRVRLWKNSLTFWMPHYPLKIKTQTRQMLCNVVVFVPLSAGVWVLSAFPGEPGLPALHGQTLRGPEVCLAGNPFLFVFWKDAKPKLWRCKEMKPFS